MQRSNFIIGITAIGFALAGVGSIVGVAHADEVGRIDLGTENV